MADCITSKFCFPDYMTPIDTLSYQGMKFIEYYFMLEARWTVQKQDVLHLLGPMATVKNQPYFSAMYLDATLLKLYRKYQVNESSTYLNFKWIFCDHLIFYNQLLLRFFSFPMSDLHVCQF